MPWKEAIKARLAIDEDTKTTKECGNCGTEHDRTRGELCPAYLKTCLKWGNQSHFAVISCRGKRKEGKDSDARKFVRAVEKCFMSIISQRLTSMNISWQPSQARGWKLSAFLAWHWSAMQRYSGGFVQESHKGLWTWSRGAFQNPSHRLRRL